MLYMANSQYQLVAERHLSINQLSMNSLTALVKVSGQALTSVEMYHVEQILYVSQPIY